MSDEQAIGQDTPSIKSPVPTNPSLLSGPGSATKINLGPVSIEAALPKWAIAVLSVLVIVGLVGAGGVVGLKKVQEVEVQAAANAQKIRSDAQKEIEKEKNSVLVPKDDMAVYQEQAIHATDRPDEKEDIPKELHQDGSILIHHYYRDGCVHVVRYGTSGLVQDQKWIFGPHHKFNPNEAPKPVEQASVQTEGSQAENLKLDLGELSEGQLHNAVVLSGSAQRSRSLSSPTQFQRVGFQGRCMDPHPGTFQFQNQQINQCIVRVDRLFQDGCSHFQFYNACNGMWDVLPNGAAKVTWTRCLH